MAVIILVSFPEDLSFIIRLKSLSDVKTREEKTQTTENLGKRMCAINKL